MRQTRYKGRLTAAELMKQRYDHERAERAAGRIVDGDVAAEGRTVAVEVNSVSAAGWKAPTGLVSIKIPARTDPRQVRLTTASLLGVYPDMVRFTPIVPKWTSSESAEPATLADFIEVNEGWYENCDEALVMKALQVGESADIGPGGASGSFIVTRVQ